jgi:hypothetical protein
MGRHLSTLPTGRKAGKATVVLISVALLLIIWAYGFVINDPQVWGRKPPNLVEGLAIVVCLLTPFSLIVSFLGALFPQKGGRRARTTTTGLRVMMNAFASK